MAQQTIGQHISTIRNLFKLNNADVRMSDRHIYYLMYNIRPQLIKETKQWVMHTPGIFQTIPDVELIDVDTVEACQIDSGCKIRRSKNPLPKIIEDYKGPMISRMTSIDGSQSLYYITPDEFTNKLRKSTFKYNKLQYYWIRNNYIYFPNIEWDMVSIEAFLEIDYISECDEQIPCKNVQDNIFRLPENLNEKMYRLILDKLSINLQIQEDTKLDKNMNNK